MQQGSQVASKKEPLVYIDGKFYPKSEAKVSVYDHGLLYGDGVFEGIRAYNGRVFQLDAHIDRLFMSAKSIDLKIPLSQEELKETIINTLRKQNLRDSYIRLVVTRGFGDLGLDPRKCPKPSIIIIAEQLKSLFGEAPATAVVASTRRNNPTALNPAVKSLNYLNNILAKLEANRANATEALMLDQNGFISEGTGDNIFIVKDGKLITPATTASILFGITRRVILQLAEKDGIQVEERNITVHELYNADEAF
ncbi:MAG TPA: branched-chain-amino-acid transaminase, partial [archaeon]|nr:branched-chain-amino-acid transaminase [archaeon]